MHNYTCIDLFCGAGGLSKGFLDAGFEIVAGFDHDEEALGTFRKNHPGVSVFKHDLSKDLTETNDTAIKNILNRKIDLIIGGPPCQGLSIAGKRLADDPRNKLYRAYLHLIKHYKPKAIVLENVPTIMSLFNGEIAKSIEKDFTEQGYTVSINTVFASDFGVPQRRRRTFFVALKDKMFEFPEPFTKLNPITCEEAIGDLPLLENNNGASQLQYRTKPKNAYQIKMRSGSNILFNHEAVEHKERTKQIISLVPDGGNYKDLPIDLQGTRKVNIAWTRMNSKKPSFTIDAGHNHHFHYKANRVPTVRECARLQSFPDNFIFLGKRTSQYRQVGNAVPPLLAYSIANKLKEYLNGSI
jgi:DNA (cytosine-5)-methyltransferase 1